MTDRFSGVRSFISGVGRVIDVGGVLTPRIPYQTPYEVDTLAALSDWTAVGMDIRHAMRSYSS